MACLIAPAKLHVGQHYSSSYAQYEIFIINGYQLLCDAHTVLEQRRGTAALFVLLTIVLFHFFFLYHMSVTLIVPIFFSWVPL